MYRIASRTRVTPSAVASPVNTGRCHEVCDERLGGEVVDLGRPELPEISIIEPSSSTSPGTRVSSVLDVGDPSKLSVLDRRNIPTTS